MPNSEIHLSPAAVRVLGSLLEKETTTPEYYPLSLLALTNACNQRSSRNPVMDLSEDEVRSALRELEDAGLAAPARGTESRVTKYVHHIGEVFNLRRGELAILCVLMLRGPQTPGELRSRTERMHSFTGMDEVEATLQQLTRREPPLARALPREPGTREIRYTNLLSPGTDIETEATDRSASRSETVHEPSERFASLEAEVAELRTRIAALEEKFAQFTGA
jgi:uncharacterized protein